MTIDELSLSRLNSLTLIPDFESEALQLSDRLMRIRWIVRCNVRGLQHEWPDRKFSSVHDGCPFGQRTVPTEVPFGTKNIGFRKRIDLLTGHSWPSLFNIIHYLLLIINLDSFLVVLGNLFPLLVHGERPRD